MRVAVFVEVFVAELVAVDVEVSVGGGVPATTVSTFDVAMTMLVLLDINLNSYVPGVVGTVKEHEPVANAAPGVFVQLT